MRRHSIQALLAACLVVGMVLVAAAPAAATVSPPTFVRWMNACYDPSSDIGCSLVNVDGLGVASNDDIYAASSTRGRVKRMASSGSMISFWGPSGTGFAFDAAHGLAIDSSDNVLVLDDHAIHRFTNAGVWIASYPDGGRFFGPRSIAVAPGGIIYVAIPNAILRFAATGTYLDQWTVDAGFGGSPGIAVGDDDDVYVSDPGHDKVQRFSSTGTFIDSFGASGTGNGQFDLPQGVAVGPDGRVYVADSGNHRVQVFTADGTYVTKFGTEGFGDGQFNDGPHAIAVGASGDIVVGDSGVRIQLFRYGSAAAARPDGRVRVGTTSAYVGDDVYNATGASQTATGSAKSGKTVTFNVSIQNDGTANDRFKLKGVGSAGGYSIVYKIGTVNITAAVKAGTFKTSSLAPGVDTLITVVVSVKSAAATGSKLTTLIMATSVADTAQKDTVKLVAKRK